MENTFKIHDKFSWGVVIMPLVSLAVIIYAFLFPFSIRLRRFTLFEYPTSKYVVLLVVLLIIAYSIHTIMKMKATNSPENVIKTTDTELIFRNLAGYKLAPIRVPYTKVGALANENDDDDGESIVVNVNDGSSYSFFAEKFVSAGEFVDFKNILKEKCTNVSTRAF